MHFPLWGYLNQPLFAQRPAMLNPYRYWQAYKIWHFNRCLRNTFLEQCWSISYQDFVAQYPNLCCRNALEEDPRWLIDRCWHLQRRDRSRRHPENPISEREIG